MKNKRLNLTGIIGTQYSLKRAVEQFVWIYTLGCVRELLRPSKRATCKRS